MVTHRRRRKSPRRSEPKEAPGNLALIQAFVNTTTPEDEGDELASPQALSRWLSRHGLLALDTELGDDDLRRAVAVREGLRAMLLANLDVELSEEKARRLERAAEGARYRLYFERGEPAGFEPASRSFDDALGGLLGIVAMARLDRSWLKLKVCARKGCRRAFYDGSKSRNGKWCISACGERVRSHAYRQTDKYKDTPKPRLRF